MNLTTINELLGTGTSEGAKKGWEGRGRLSSWREFKEQMSPNDWNRVVKKTKMTAKGTSEGVTKAWDTRGRGRKKKSDTGWVGERFPDKGRVGGREVGLEDILQKLEELKPLISNTRGSVQTGDIKEEYEKAKNLSDKLKIKLDRAQDKMEHIHDVNSLWGKMLHVVAQLGSYSQGMKELYWWMANAAVIAEASHHVAAVHHVADKVLMHLQPLITAITNSGIFAEEQEIDAQRATQSLRWPVPSKAPRTPQPKTAGLKKLYHPMAKIAPIGKEPSVPSPRRINVPKPYTPHMSKPGGFGGTRGMGSTGGFGGTRGIAAKKVKGFGDWGEPMAGGMSHAHIEPMSWFHPPSLTKRLGNEETRIPADNPREKNDKFLDKTKRNSPDTEEFRMKLLKRAGPGGLPPQIPAHTTLIAPNTAAYMPSQLWASVGRRRRMEGRGGSSTAYGRRGCI